MTKECHAELSPVMAEKEWDKGSCVTFLWKIENFSYYSSELHLNGICSPVFYPFNLTDGGLFLRLIPKAEILTLNLNAFLKDFCSPMIFEWSFLNCKGPHFVGGITLKRVLRLSHSFTMSNCPTVEDVTVTRKTEFLPHDTLTVQLRIWKSSADLTHAKHIYARSRIEITKDCFLWNVEGFVNLKLRQKVVSPITVQYFPTYLSSPTTLRLKLSLTGDSLKEASVDFEVAAEGVEEERPTKISLSVLDNERKPMKLVEHRHTFSARASICVVPEFLSRKQLLEKKDNCLRDDVLSVFCEFFCARDCISKSIEKSLYNGIAILSEKGIETSSTAEASCQTLSAPSVESRLLEDSVTILQDDFLSLYRDQTLADFTLCSGEVSFPVHKSILSARSLFFRAMFSSNMEESESNSLNIPDIDADTLNRMLTFLYVGTLEPNRQWEADVKLYYAADKYKIQSLKNHCFTILTSQLSVSNVSDILTLAARYQYKNLASFSREFILSHFEEVMYSTEWEEFMENHPRLAGKTMHELNKLQIQNSKTT